MVHQPLASFRENRVGHTELLFVQLGDQQPAELFDRESVDAIRGPMEEPHCVGLARQRTGPAAFRRGHEQRVKLVRIQRGG
jgi:hypothetical protein